MTLQLTGFLRCSVCSYAMQFCDVQYLFYVSCVLFFFGMRRVIKDNISNKHNTKICSNFMSFIFVSYIIMPCIVMPCYLEPHFHVLHCQRPQMSIYFFLNNKNLKKTLPDDSLIFISGCSNTQNVSVNYGLGKSEKSCSPSA